MDFTKQGNRAVFAGVFIIVKFLVMANLNRLFCPNGIFIDVRLKLSC